MSHKHGETRVFTDEGYKHTINKDGTKYLEKSLIEKLGITPGPYIHIIYDHGGSRLYREEGGNRNLICDTYGQKENALCFSQAPEMLEALIKQELSHEKCNAVSEPIVKLIEKATGTTWPEIKDLLNA